MLDKDVPEETYHPPKELGRTLWGLKFRSPIMNAAGIYKNGTVYETSYRQGAGAFLGGTGTLHQRNGNVKKAIRWPFLPLPQSGAALNWMGLPNDGDTNVAEVARGFEKQEGFPIGWSVMAPPDLEGEKKLAALVQSMHLYMDAGVDFLEMNESCPNTEEGALQDSGLEERLQYVKKNFLDKRERKIPVIVKFSNDTEDERVEELMSLLFKLDFDGINFGNTSTKYAEHLVEIDEKERSAYKYFTSSRRFGVGGGLSGRPLKERSLALATHAAKYLKAHPPKHEFHVIRTGGIENSGDLRATLDAGISLCQWYTGYFEAFTEHGHAVYKKMYAEL